MSADILPVYFLYSSSLVKGVYRALPRESDSGCRVYVVKVNNSCVLNTRKILVNLCNGTLDWKQWINFKVLIKHRIQFLASIYFLMINFAHGALKP